MPLDAYSLAIMRCSERSQRVVARCFVTTEGEYIVDFNDLTTRETIMLASKLIKSANPGGEERNDGN